MGKVSTRGRVKNQMKFRLLKAEEIECRMATRKDNGCSLLLYKDARVDQNILDETVGSMNWQRHHSRDNANCIVSIWDSDKNQWIEKEDTGTESYSEAEKGLASDSFKRACFNWGIGRELYTAPFIWINGSVDKYAKFYVKSIGYDDNRCINALSIVDENGKEVWGMNKSGKKTKPEATKAVDDVEIKAQWAAMKERITNPAKIDAICKFYKVNSLDEMSIDNINDYIRRNN